MSFTGNIKKILIASLWVVVSGSVLILLIAAIRARSNKACEGYTVEINGESKGDWFIDKQDVTERLTLKGAEKIKGKKLEDFDLKKMEERLEKDPWIKDAELFFDNNEILRVKIRERSPVARVFTLAGASFYIDEDAKRIPLSEKLAGRLPVFTGFPSEKINLRGVDSSLLADMRTIGMFVLNNPFWMAQLEQIDITPQRNFEMIPVVGNHVVEFGNGVEYEKKFARLLKFYKDVLSKAGMNKYARINVQYEKQVIGIKKAVTVSKADSIRASKNLEQLILDAQRLQEQAVYDTIRSVSNTTSDTTNAPLPVQNSNPAPENSKTVTPTKNQPGKHPTYGKRNGQKRQPKSVMPKS